MIWELLAYNTNSWSVFNDVRYREYTSSRRRKEAFEKIPRIQFTDSGHAIEFISRIHIGSRKPLRTELRDYVNKHLREIMVRKPKEGKDES